MLPELISVARQWSADLIVRESLEFAGCVAAEALGLPHASVAAAADSALDRRRELAGPLTGLRQQASLPADPDGDMAFRYLHLCFTPPGFDGPGPGSRPQRASSPTTAPPRRTRTCRRGWIISPDAPPCWSAWARCSTARPGCTRPSSRRCATSRSTCSSRSGSIRIPSAWGRCRRACGPAHPSPGGAAAPVRAAGVTRRLQQRQRSTRRGRSAGHPADRGRSALLRQPLPGPRGRPRYLASRAQRPGDPRSCADGAGRSRLPRAGTAHARRDLCAPAGRRRRYRARAGRGSARGAPELRCWTLTGGRRVRPGSK